MVDDINFDKLDFSKFDTIITQYEKEKENTNKNIDINTVSIECEHLVVSDENGIIICVDCGMEIKTILSFDKEWRYYGASDSRHSSDPSRCYIRKNEDKTIYHDVEDMGFDTDIVNLANTIYSQVTENKIYRGNSRKAIVFACIFYAYKESNTPQSCESLINIFQLDRKAGLRGMKHVSLNAPKGSKLRTTYITPAHIIADIVDKFVILKEHKDDIIKIYNNTKNKSYILNRSRPLSCAAGICWSFIKTNVKSIGIKEFVRKVQLSELTIVKISKEVDSILKTIQTD